MTKRPSSHNVESPAPGRDSLLNQHGARLDEWARLWAMALPGFTLDSLWLMERTHWAPLYTRPFVRPTKESAGDVTFDLLGIPSPDGRYTLDVDTYQFIEPSGDSLDVGGEPDSQCSLIDHRTHSEAVLQSVGTMGSFQWGSWLSATSFAVGGCIDAGDNGPWKQPRLWIYSILDSTLSVYQTRVVSEAENERYTHTWLRWLLDRYRKKMGQKRPA